jgi:leucyl aminopeptidase (aminopeptidase T)
MIGFSREMILQGMAADYQNLYDLTHRVLEKVKKASVIKVKNSEGTEIQGEFSQSLKWIADDGKIIDPVEWHNLPGTEVFTCPVTVNGTIAARVFGDYFSEKFGYLERPALVEVKDARFVSITTDNQDLKTEFERYMKAEENNDRVGEFAIGTNTGIEKLIGNMLQDEKYPGFHMALGFPYPEMTGADWNASGHIDLVSADNDIWVDDKQIMAKGKFLI